MSGDKKKALFMTRNTKIVITHIAAACTLLFCCCFFFFQNTGMFKSDITSYMAWSPIIFFAGLIFICFYIIMLVFNLEARTTHNADKYDLAYKIIFGITLAVLIVRSFLGDFMCTESWCGTKGEDGEILTCHAVTLWYGTSLYVTITVTVVAVISGIVTWLTPKIKDNDNNEF